VTRRSDLFDILQIKTGLIYLDDECRSRRRSRNYVHVLVFEWLLMRSRLRQIGGFILDWRLFIFKMNISLKIRYLDFLFAYYRRVNLSVTRIIVLKFMFNIDWGSFCFKIGWLLLLFPFFLLLKSNFVQLLIFYIIK